MNTIRRPVMLFFSVLLFNIGCFPVLRAEPPHFGNGIKIGEVDSDSAIVWARLTQIPGLHRRGVPFLDGDEAVPAGLKLSDMQYSVPGAGGEARLGIWKGGSSEDASWTAWRAADEGSDHTMQFELEGLRPGTRYQLKIEAREASDAEERRTVEGSFRTAPSAEASSDVRFAVVTCHDFIRRDDGYSGHLIYKSMAGLEPDFLVHAGDIEYYDKPMPWAKSPELARYKWNRLFALPNQRNFYANHAAYFMKDDHETLKNDCWPGQTYGDLTFEQGLAIFREQVPMGKKTYRTRRWGKHLQIWMVEGRDFRSPNTMPDGPGKTIWGDEQKAWFFDTFAKSDATFRILISPTPIVGPDRERKRDNHSNANFSYEGNQIREFLAEQENAFVICGDRHWQYASVDGETGVREFACGAGSDTHAGGFRQELRGPEHRFLRIAGGFLEVSVEGGDGSSKPSIAFIHRSVMGELENREDFSAAHARTRFEEPKEAAK